MSRRKSGAAQRPLRRLILRALAEAPNSVEAHCALGGAFLAVGDSTSAKIALPF
jgi:hypothetical protein